MILRMFALLTDYLRQSYKLLSSGDPKKIFAWFLGTLLGAVDGILF